MTAQNEILLCEVFRSPRREQTYLYVDRAEGMERVPEALLAGFGDPETVLILKLYAGRKLAQADSARVMEAIRKNGFYLQVPPARSPQEGQTGC